LIRQWEASTRGPPSAASRRYVWYGFELRRVDGVDRGVPPGRQSKLVGSRSFGVLFGGKTCVGTCHRGESFRRYDGDGYFGMVHGQVAGCEVVMGKIGERSDEVVCLIFVVAMVFPRDKELNFERLSTIITIITVTM
jgi:hypothetical protein